MPQEKTDPKDLHDLFDVGQAPSSDTTVLSAAEVVEAAELSLIDESWEETGAGRPSRPLLGGLPLSRIIPQDVHSVVDYVDAAAVIAGAALSACPRARAASLTIGGAGLAASSLTDYRLSLAKVIPIEAHETVDYAFGLSAIVAPFVLGYRKTAPRVAALHVALGVGTILAALFTDYRAHRGVGARLPS